jgi:predicted O-methyltransferase YrrM
MSAQPSGTITKADLNFLWPINWLGLHREYLQAGEMEIIAALLREIEAKAIVEIGCRDGRTARVLLHNVSSLVHYLGIDVPMSYVPALVHQRAEMVRDPGALVIDDTRFELMLRERGSLDLKPEDFNFRYDGVFIDGDHSLNAVLHDSELAGTIVRKGGIVIWHDYNQSPHVDVKRALDRLIAEGWPIQVVEGTWLAFCRM